MKLLFKVIGVIVAISIVANIVTSVEHSLGSTAFQWMVVVILLIVTTSKK